MTLENGRIDRWVLASLLLHGALASVFIFLPQFFPGAVRSWGSAAGGSGGIGVKLVGSVAGVALPSPEVVRENVPANESAGFYKSEAAAPPEPAGKAELIPETTAPVKTSPARKPDRPAAAPKSAPEPAAPLNAVPFGQGGKPALAYGQFSTGAGEAGIEFGDGVFGAQYGWYVDAITRRISQNWLQSLVDSRIQRAPRVYLSFDISRNGTIGNIEVKQPSGIPSLDRSAQRAVQASNPLPPLPAAYRGNNVDVILYFEYSR